MTVANLRVTRKDMRRESESCVSKDGYFFDPASDRWKLSKDVTITITFSSRLEQRTAVGFRCALRRYAEELAPGTARSACELFKRFMRDTNSTRVTTPRLMAWRARLGPGLDWQLAGLRSFLVAWHEYGFRGVPRDAVDLLAGWRLKAGKKGEPVASGCPETGPYTDLELNSILVWANSAVAKREIAFCDYAYLLTVAMTARRPTQIAALRGKDLLNVSPGDQASLKIDFPRAKQRGVGFREAFRKLAVNDDLFLVLTEKHRQSVKLIEAKLGERLSESIAAQVPIFLNEHIVERFDCLSQLSTLLYGPVRDVLHATTASLDSALHRCGVASTARSERTGEFIRLSARRFRYTRGTKLRREGFGPFVISELLDHSDIQNVRVYTQNTAQEAVVIDELIGRKLAPFAQACLGRLVTTEREAIRGGDPTSRVPNGRQHAVGTCGNYGFCASGYRACYTCSHFQPWLCGPHAEVLADLYEEKERTRALGCGDDIVNADDLLILAVEHCVAMCAEAKSKPAPAAVVELRSDD